MKRKVHQILLNAALLFMSNTRRFVIFKVSLFSQPVRMPDIYLSFNKIDLRREGSLNGHSIFKIIHSSIFVSLVLCCPYNNEPLIQVELKSLSFLLTRYKIQSDI